MKKKNSTVRPEKVKNSVAFKRGAYATVLTVVVAIAIVALNILVTALSARFPLKTDITAEKVYSLSQENIDYIRDIDKEINITVCVESEDMYSTYMSYYSGVTDSTGKYFAQTPQLLQNYVQYNSEHITVEYLDPASPDFYSVTDRHPESDFTYGDILVECVHEGENVRYSIIGATDIYELTDESGYAQYGYGSYTVSGNKLESALTTAINRVLMEKTEIIGYITQNCDTAGILSVESNLNDNNYDLQAIESLALIDAIPGEMSTLVIDGPKADFSASDLEKIDTFLDNDGKLGKNLIVLPDPSVGRLNNLYDFLEDRGIMLGTGTVYETDDSRHIEHTMMWLNLVDNDFNAGLGDAFLLCDNMAPLTIEADGEAYHELISTSATCVVRPFGSASDWAPSSTDVQGSYSAAVLSCELVYDDDYNASLSNIVTFASTDFLTNQYAQQGVASNVNVFVNLLNNLHQRDKDSITFVTKTVTSETFVPVTSTAKVLQIVFIGVVPVVLIAVSIVVFIRRKSL